MPYCSHCGKEVPESTAFCPSCGTPLQAASSTQQPQPGFSPRSGLDALTKNRQAQDYWFRRLIAFIIDAVIVFAVIGVVVAAVTIPALITSQFMPRMVSLVFGLSAGLFSALSGFIFVLYFTFAEATYGASVGKGVMGLHVQTDGGDNPSLGSSFLRNVSKIYWVLLLLDVVVGLALEADYNRKFSDRFVRASVTAK